MIENVRLEQLFIPMADADATKTVAGDSASAASSLRGWQKTDLEDILHETPDFHNLRVSSQVDDFLVVERRQFDLTLFDEPHRAISLLLQLGSGQFIHRVFSKTISKGVMLASQPLRMAS